MQAASIATSPATMPCLFPAQFAGHASTDAPITCQNNGSSLSALLPCPTTCLQSPHHTHCRPSSAHSYTSIGYPSKPKKLPSTLRHPDRNQICPSSPRIYTQAHRLCDGSTADSSAKMPSAGTSATLPPFLAYFSNTAVSACISAGASEPYALGAMSDEFAGAYEFP